MVNDNNFKYYVYFAQMVFPNYLIISKKKLYVDNSLDSGLKVKANLNFQCLIKITS